MNTDNAKLCAELDNLRAALDQSNLQVTNLTTLLDAQKSEILYLHEHESALTAKIIPALPMPVAEQPKKPRWKFW